MILYYKPHLNFRQSLKGILITVHSVIKIYSKYFFFFKETLSGYYYKFRSNEKYIADYKSIYLFISLYFSIRFDQSRLIYQLLIIANQ